MVGEARSQEFRFSHLSKQTSHAPKFLSTTDVKTISRRRSTFVGFTMSFTGDVYCRCGAAFAARRRMF
jgi:hypothetical protein